MPHCEWALETAIQSTATDIFPYFKTFITTILLEAPFYFYLLSRFSFRKRLLGLLTANVLTHPIVYFLIPMVLSSLNVKYGFYLTLAEGFAVIAEITFVVLIFQTQLMPTLLLLAMANLFSWWVGALS